ncbi:hypothetical protein D3C72_748580 [compost metagenome]
MNIKNTQVIVQDLKKLTGHYLENVERFSLQQLQWVPSEGGWSLGQMYNALDRNRHTYAAEERGALSIGERG